MKNGPSAIGIVGLQGIGRPLGDGPIEIQDRRGRLGRAAPRDRGLERLLEPGDLGQEG